MNTVTEQINPQAKTAWTWPHTPFEPVYKNTKLPRHPSFIEWPAFLKRLRAGAWIWLVIVSTYEDTHALTRASIARRVAKMGGPELTTNQVKEQLVKLYALKLIEHKAANVDTYRRRRRATGHFDPGEVQERKAAGGIIFRDNKPFTVCLPQSHDCRKLHESNHGGLRKKSGRPPGKSKPATKLALISQPLENQTVVDPQPNNAPIEPEIGQNTVRFEPKNQVISTNQDPPDLTQDPPDPPAGDSNSPVNSLGTIFALKILSNSMIYTDRSRLTDRQSLSNTYSSFSLSGEREKRTLAGETGSSFSKFFSQRENVILKNQSPSPAVPTEQSDKKPTPAVSAEQFDKTPNPSPASSEQVGKTKNSPAPAEGVKVQPPWLNLDLQPAERAKAFRKAHSKTRQLAPPLQPGDADWRPTLQVWPTVPMPRDWDKLSTVDTLAAAYLVRMYTEYRVAKQGNRWWFKGRAQSQPWWPRAVATVRALREAEISPVAWLAWVDGALWPSKGPAPHQMVFSAETVTKHQSWCRGTYEDYLFRPMRIPPVMKELWAEWKQMQIRRTPYNAVVIERFRRLQEQADVDAVAMQADLHSQVREGRWIW